MASSQAERLRAQIEDEILSFKIKPGERLDETRLAERYGTSRTPVREALRQLSANGLVEIIPHKGAAVIKLGVRDLFELFEVLAELEGACAKLAAKTRLRADLEAIRGAHQASQRFVEPGDDLSYYKANIAFHEAIYRASHNATLIRMVIGVHNRIAPYRRLQLEQVDRIKSSYEEHEQLVLAIESGRGDDADRLAQSHILNTGLDVRRLLSLLSDDPAEQPQLGLMEDLPRLGHRNGAVPVNKLNAAE